LRQAWRITLDVLLSPTQFFKRGHLEGPIGKPLAYAILLHGVTALASFGWKEALHGPIMGRLADFKPILRDAHEFGFAERPRGFEQLQGALEVLTSLKQMVLATFWGASSIWLSPLTTALSIVWAAGWAWVACRLILPRSRQSTLNFTGIFRLVCFASAPVVWTLIPVMGPAIHQVMWLTTLTLAIKKSYNISTLRASLVALFPHLLFLGILMVGLGYLGLLVFRMIQPLFF